MAPSAIRDLRRVLRYRNLVVRQATRMKNRIAGLLMETRTPYNKERLHGRAYFNELLGRRARKSAITTANRKLRKQPENPESLKNCPHQEALGSIAEAPLILLHTLFTRHSHQISPRARAAAFSSTTRCRPSSPIAPSLAEPRPGNF
jgi:hypothetical protein